MTASSSHLTSYGLVSYEFYYGFLAQQKSLGS